MRIRILVALALIALVVAACGSPAGETVARYENITLTREELNQRVERVRAGFEGQPATPSDAEIEEQLVMLFIQQNLILGVSRERGIEVNDTDIDSQIEDFRANFEMSGTNIDEVVRTQLGYEDANDSDFRQFVSSIVAQDRLAVTLVPTDTVEAEVREQVEAAASEQVEEIQIAHILVETEEEAEEVINRLEAGEDFGELAGEVSTDPGSAQNGGTFDPPFDWYRRGAGFDPIFEEAAFGLEVGETTEEPVETQFGYHIIRVLDRREGPAIPEDQIPLVIEQQVQSQVQFQRGQAFSQLIQEERQRAIDEGRLEEPTYPTPEPEQPPAMDVNPEELVPEDGAEQP